MIIHEITKIGTYHNNYCEDYTLHHIIGDQQYLIAVMDGCTMGTESYFASALTGKILKKIAKEQYYKNYISSTAYTVSTLLRKVSEQLFNQLKHYAADLHLERHELLTTVILGIVDTHKRTACVQVIGDGLVHCNGSTHIFDQENVPDYLGYHLRKEFSDWYRQQEQLIIYENIEDLSISTDGIFTFSFDQPESSSYISEKEIIHLLLEEQSELYNERMFSKKLRQLEQQYGLRNTDDIGIVRISLKNKSTNE